MSWGFMNALEFANYFKIRKRTKFTRRWTEPKFTGRNFVGLSRHNGGRNELIWLRAGADQVQDGWWICSDEEDIEIHQFLLRWHLFDPATKLYKLDMGAEAQRERDGGGALQLEIGDTTLRFRHDHVCCLFVP